MLKRAIKAFQNLQLTEHHIDSLQQSATGDGRDERRRGRRGRRGEARLARPGRAALLRHRPPHLPGPYNRPDGLLVPVRVPQLPAAGLRRAAVYVQRAVLGRGRRHSRRHGRLFPRAGR